MGRSGRECGKAPDRERPGVRPRNPGRMRTVSRGSSPAPGPGPHPRLGAGPGAATGRLSRSSRARNTTAIPPAPTCASSRYPATSAPARNPAKARKSSLKLPPHPTIPAASEKAFDLPANGVQAVLVSGLTAFTATKTPGWACSRKGNRDHAVSSVWALAVIPGGRSRRYFRRRPVRASRTRSLICGFDINPAVCHEVTINGGCGRAGGPYSCCLCAPSTLPRTPIPARSPQPAGSYCMDAPAMSLGLHERGIHVVRRSDERVSPVTAASWGPWAPGNTAKGR